MICIHCHQVGVRKNGHTHNDKQNYYCPKCGRQFVEGGQAWFVSDADKLQIDLLLLERISLRGICRVMGVSMTWLMSYLQTSMMKSLALLVLRKICFWNKFIAKSVAQEWSFWGYN